MSRSSRAKPQRQVVETLERRMMLSGAVDGVVQEISPLDSQPAARFAPAGKSLFKSTGYLTKAAPGNAADIALSYFKSNAAWFGITAADVGTPIVTSQYSDSDSGMTHVYWRQQVNGLEIGNANANANVTRDGRILSINSAFIAGVASVLAGKRITPGLAVSDALLAAADRLGIAHSQQPQLLQAPVGTARVSKLRATELSQDDVAARLRYVVAPDGPRLAWNFILRVPGDQHWYDASVDANDGRLLFTADWTSRGHTDDHSSTPVSAKGQAGGANASIRLTGDVPATVLPPTYNASYNVYPFPVKNADAGPRVVVNNPWDLAASPFGWHDTDGDDAPETSVTQGNNVSAQDDLDSNNSGGTRPSGGADINNQSYNYALNPASPPLSNLSAATVNLFYWNNILHDVHQRYGFTEVAGNFQLVNYSGAGAGNDRVQADAQDGGGTNNANFSTPADGSTPRMQMYVWNYTTPNRDSDFDSQIIIHEYGHGVSNRLTGGPNDSSSLGTVQSSGMGEGWSDWWAMMLLQTDGAAAMQTGNYSMSPWILGEDAAGPGIRRYPYSFDKSIDPRTWTMFNASTNVHQTGEIWCSTLWDMAVLLERKWGFNPNVASGYTTSTGSGNLLALRLVMDALKLQPANPSVTQARDAILQADTALTGGANHREIWTAFARRGLGTSTVNSSTNATSMTNAWDIPAAVSAPPVVSQTTPLSASFFTPLSSITFQFSQVMNPGTFSLASDLTFTGPGGVNLAPQISGAAWTNGNKTLTVNFSTQSTDGTYTMTIGPNIQLGASATQMDQDYNGTPGQATDSYVATIALDTRPGPDAAGYEASTTTFQAINLVTGGGISLLDNQDDTNDDIPLGANTFNFYGVTYTGSNQLFVNENGLITFGSGSVAFNNGNFVNSPLQPAIAVLFDDWATDNNAADKVLYRLDAPNNKLIIEWSAVTNRGDGNSAFNTNPGTFQAILSLNTGATPGDIVLNYVDLNIGPANSAYSNGGSATVGIKSNGLAGANGDNNRLRLALYNNPNIWLANNTAIRIGIPVQPDGLWDGGGDGTNWTDPANWSNNSLPDANDDVTIDIAVEPTIVLASGQQIVRSLNLREDLTITGGSLRVSESLTIGASSVMSMPASASTLIVGGLSIADGSTLDLSDNDMIVDYTGTTQLDAIVQLIRSGRDGGNWTGDGIISSAARDNVAQNTSLGAIEASQYSGGTFNGHPLDGSAVLVKYTYYGDHDFNGKVDGADYARIDNQFNQQSTLGDIAGWFNGDFDYNDKLDGADYALIDSAFNSQLGVL